MSIRVQECVAEELSAARVLVTEQARRFLGAYTSTTKAREQQGIEQQRERYGEAAVELALALAEELWCRTCRATVENGRQGRNHRQMGHVVELIR